MVISAIVLSIGMVTASAADTTPAQDGGHAVSSPRVYEGPPLTLEAAIDEALVKNPELVALRQQFEAARQRPSQERYLMPPSFEAQIWQWPVTTVNPLNTNMYMFTIHQELPGRGKRDLRAAVAEKDVEIASNDIATRARDVLNAVMRAYADLVVARRAIDIHLASVNLLRQFADVSSIKYAAGKTPQQDVLKAVTEISKLHEDLVMDEETAALAAARLNTLLDRDPQMDIGPLDEPREQITLPPSEDLQRIALEHQPELRAAHLAEERAQTALAVANRESRPDFFVGGGYMLMPRQSGAWTASAGITWPSAPWSRGRIAAQQAEAAADVEAAKAKTRVVERQIRLAVHGAYVRAIAATDRASLLRTSVMPQSEQTLEVSRVAYQTDRVDFLAVLDNQRALLDARLDYYRALSERELALADLARAVGVEQLLPADTAGGGK